jgi:hypothetical protein
LFPQLAEDQRRPQVHGGLRHHLLIANGAEHRQMVGEPGQ